MSYAAFHFENSVGLRNIYLSKLDHAAWRHPVYASQLRSPSVHATLGSDRWPTFIGQEYDLPGCFRRFLLCHPLNNFPPLQALPGALSTVLPYKRPFAEPKGCISERQQPANCSHSRCSKKSDCSVRSSLSCGHSLATPTSDIDVLLGFVSVPSCQLVECVLHTHWRASIRWRTDNELARGIRKEWHHTP